MLDLLNDRAREIFRLLVDTYCQTGDPIGSKTMAERMGLSLSSATIRHVMSQLEELGLLYSPHPSAGRIPTEAGLRLFVEGLLNVDTLTAGDRQSLEYDCDLIGKNLPKLLEKSIKTLSELSKCASLVLAPKLEFSLKHIEFVALSPGRALVILVTAEGRVENRLIEIPPHISSTMLKEISDFINVRLNEKNLQEVSASIEEEFREYQSEINKLTQFLVSTGLDIWSKDLYPNQLLIQGQSQLLKDVEQQKDLERLQHLFEELEKRDRLMELLEVCQNAEGMQIFIGASNPLFNHSGCSMVVAPYHNRSHQIIGMIGVIGPTHLDYARIIPMVNYTSQLISRSFS